MGGNLRGVGSVNYGWPTRKKREFIFMQEFRTCSIKYYHFYTNTFGSSLKLETHEPIRNKKHFVATKFASRSLITILIYDSDFFQIYLKTIPNFYCFVPSLKQNYH